MKREQIICDICGAKTEQAPGIFSDAGWLAKPTTEGISHLCPTCRQATEEKKEPVQVPDDYLETLKSMETRLAEIAKRIGYIGDVLVKTETALKEIRKAIKS